MSAYYLKQVVPSWSLATIYRGMADFMVIQVIGLLLVMLFPRSRLVPGLAVRRLTGRSACRANGAVAVAGPVRRASSSQRTLRSALAVRARLGYSARCRPGSSIRGSVDDEKHEGGHLMGRQSRLGRHPPRLALALAVALGAGAAQAESFTLGYSVGFLTDPFQAIQVDLTMAEAEKAGLKTLPVANANGDPGKQITDFHNLIAQGAAGHHRRADRQRRDRAGADLRRRPERAGGRDRHRPGRRQGGDDRARRQHPHGRGRLPGRWARRSAARAPCSR